MSQSNLFETPRFTVTEFTRRVRRLLEDAPFLADVWVQGEISNFSRPSSGHLYYTLKDAGASLRCVTWKLNAARMRGLNLQDGLLVEVHGKITVYEPTGQYQFVVDVIRPAGEGALFAEFMRLKAVLEGEGLFASERKRAIPDLPKKIGIVTSPTGAALQDMLNVLRRRLPLAEVVLAPSAVQGVEAPQALVKAIQSLNQQVRPDVILLARGGGSMEDLWAFNDEYVIRAVAHSQAPVITGVGHETDFTLVDFAADRRAPTPTAAAELATPITIFDLKSALLADRQLLDRFLMEEIADRRAALNSLNTGLRHYSPARRLQTEFQRLDDLQRRAGMALDHQIVLDKVRLNGLVRRLQALSPLGILRRGYAVVTGKLDGKIVYTANQVQPGADLQVRLAEGRLDVRVLSSLEEA